MRRMLCCIKAVPFYIRTGIWCPHVYEEVSRHKGIVMATEDGFRVSENLLHSERERVHPDATIVLCRCVSCGKEDLSWYDREPPVING